jgi:V-type H+-transporting ATPase subunit D
LKKVQGKKKRDAQAADAEKAITDAEANAAELEDNNAPTSSDLLNDKDEDVIF